MIFPNLQIFRILYPVYSDDSSISEMFIKFLENNGKNLTDLYINYYKDNSINLSIIQYCLNLKNLVIIIKDNKLDILKNIFNSCQDLESIKIWCDEYHYINEEEMLDIVAKDSPKNFYRLKIYNLEKSKLLPEALESFFTSLGNGYHRNR